MQGVAAPDGVGDDVVAIGFEPRDVFHRERHEVACGADPYNFYIDPAFGRERIAGGDAIRPDALELSIFKIPLDEYR